MEKRSYDEVYCPACAETIKAAAKKCKHCGHVVTQADIRARLDASAYQAKRSVRRVAIIGGGIVTLIAAGAIFGDRTGDGGSSAGDRAETAVRAKSISGFDCLSGWDGSHRQFVSKVKDRLRDPESFEHIETRVTPAENGSHAIIMQFRSRNGFGGMNVGRAIGSFDHETCEPAEPISDG